MNLYKISAFFCFILISFSEVYSQEVPHSVNNSGVYDFLDELAGLRIISINSAVKPYSRMYIAIRLKEAEAKKELLNKRQARDLEFYMMDFGKEIYPGEKWKRRRDLFYHKDTLFSLTINPVLGAELFSNSNGKATYWKNGAEARGYVNKWGFYASLRDNHEKPDLSRSQFLTQRHGDYIKGGTDWSEMQGGVTYSWSWGNIGLIKERQVWGNNYNGANIFGGNNPSFVQLRLQLHPVEWFSFNYFHGWLNSRVVDSSASHWLNSSYGLNYRKVYFKKYISANMFTFTPFRYVNVSFGNSIVYTEDNINPAYLIPLFFYKSVDESLRWGIDNMNSQMFFDISSRRIKNVHLYGTLYIDDLSVSRFTNANEWNFFSWKAGARLIDLPVSNFSLTTEFTYTYPLTFRHYVPTVTFETSGYNLGHYLRDNSRELYISLDYKPVRASTITIYFSEAVRGPDYTENEGYEWRGIKKPLETINWKNRTIGIKASYQALNDLYLWISTFRSEISGDSRWTPKYFYGNNNNLNIGATFGF